LSYRVEYQYSQWRDRDGETSHSWWVDCEEPLGSKAAMTKFIKKMNSQYEFIDFRAVGAPSDNPKVNIDTRTEEDTNIMSDKTVTIYTDGSAHYKDKLGGIGVYIKFGTGDQMKEKIISRGYSNTTNNRMELRAIIEGMKAITLKNYKVHIYTDSELCVNTFTSWIGRWEKEGYAGRKNVDLLIEGLEELRKFPKGNVVFHWVKGHNGIQGNEIADLLATDGRKSSSHKKCR